MRITMRKFKTDNMAITKGQDDVYTLLLFHIILDLITTFAPD